MKDEYIIINKTAIQKRIEELEIIEKQESINGSLLVGAEIETLKKVLSQSTPLIPVIKKTLFDAFTDAPERGTKEYARYVSDYISNLKLDI